MIQKSYDGKATLYIIPTPIGNLDDITLRAIKILKEVEVVFSEDTRVTLNLLNHLKIKKKLIASHEHNEEKTSMIMLDYLKSGHNIGLVTDRGTPIISDPGYYLVKNAIAAGYNVVSLPGATALIPALTSSGIYSPKFSFIGFLDNKEGKRLKELSELESYNKTLIFYESPHRIEKTLKNMYEIFGNRQISISREISKRFEEVYRGDLESAKETYKNVKGELVIIVEGNYNKKTYDKLTVVEHVNLYIKEGYDHKEAIKKVSVDRSMKKSDVYNAYHNIKQGD